MFNAKNYTMGKVLFSESVVIDHVTRNEHLLGHLANKVVPPLNHIKGAASVATWLLPPQTDVGTLHLKEIPGKMLQFSKKMTS